MIYGRDFLKSARACLFVGYGMALCHTMARRLVPYLVQGYGTGLVPYYGTGAYKKGFPIETK